MRSTWKPPKLTDAERNALLQQIANMQTQMMQSMNPANLQAAEQKKNDDFGCYLLQVSAKGATTGPVDATMICGENFENGMLKTTSTMSIGATLRRKLHQLKRVLVTRRWRWIFSKVPCKKSRWTPADRTLWREGVYDHIQGG